ncbi:MAG: ABC transporter ATP-binding protein [Dehalococcoidia bacterium]|nr:ABC transporter ATP-binding protein [Dehalococcoidia bacterium]
MTALATAPVFELAEVCYAYSGGPVALDRVTLTIREGERVVLLGANGSGKSTLLKLMDGLLPPTAGRLRVYGVEASQLADDVDATHHFHRRVGIVFQDPDIQLFSPTVGDDVAFGPLQLGLPLVEVRHRVEAALSKMGILHLRDRAPFELSGGEKKRAAIASVLSLEPDVILLDEPTASLDPRTKWSLVSLLQQLAAEGKTLVAATHELEIVPLIADRVIVIGENRSVLADGTPDAILADRALLIRANIIHEHLHRHVTLLHEHMHEDGHHDDEGVSAGNEAG